MFAHTPQSNIVPTLCYSLLFTLVEFPTGEVSTISEALLRRTMDEKVFILVFDSLCSFWMPKPSEGIFCARFSPSQELNSIPHSTGSTRVWLPATFRSSC